MPANGRIDANIVAKSEKLDVVFRTTIASQPLPNTSDCLVNKLPKTQVQPLSCPHMKQLVKPVQLIGFPSCWIGTAPTLHENIQLFSLREHYFCLYFTPLELLRGYELVWSSYPITISLVGFCITSTSAMSQGTSPSKPYDIPWIGFCPNYPWF